MQTNTAPKEEWEIVRSSRKGEWLAWCTMKQRCNNPNCKAYQDYGGRGIRLCERWMTFKMFFLDMGRKPTHKHQLNRKDNNLGYFPENCEWVTPKENCRNRRSSRPITYNGITMTLIAWAEKLGLSSSTLAGRLDKWPLEKAMNMPLVFPVSLHPDDEVYLKKSLADGSETERTLADRYHVGRRIIRRIAARPPTRALPVKRGIGMTPSVVVDELFQLKTFVQSRESFTEDLAGHGPSAATGLNFYRVTTKGTQ